jgi:hypothetical protein
MTARKPSPIKPDCDVCKGRGWFYAGDIRSPWPAKCFRCFPPHQHVKAPNPKREGTK